MGISPSRQRIKILRREIGLGGRSRNVTIGSYSTDSYIHIPFSITKKENIEIKLFQYCSPKHVYFLVLPQQSSLLGLYGPVLHHLLGNMGKYSPSCQTNAENQLIQYCPTRKDSTGSINFRNWECLYYDSSRYRRWYIAWALENTSCSALGISLVLRLYFTVYPSSCQNTDTV